MEAEIVVYGADWCEDTQRTRKFLDGRGVEYTYVNVDKDDNAERKVIEWNGGRRLTPTVVISGGGRTQRLTEPEDDKLEAALEQQGLEPAA